MKTTQPFNLAAHIRSRLAGTYGKIESNESRAIADEIERYGHPDSGMTPLPGHALNLQSRATPLTTLDGNGGYLTETNLQGYLPALQAATTVLPLGAKIVSLDKGATVVPSALTAIAPAWEHDESTSVAATVNTYSQKAFAPKLLMVNVPISVLLLKQSNANERVTEELVNSSGAEIDKQIIQGIGGSTGTPLGIMNMQAITSTSGATLAYSTLVSMMTGVANANAIVNADALGFLTTPTVAGILKQRYYSAANFRIWEGSVPSGTIDGMTAMTSTNVPSGSLLHGDFSRLLIAQWADGLQIDVDPYTNFQQAYVTVRLCLRVDCVVAGAASFQTLTGVT